MAVGVVSTSNKPEQGSTDSASLLISSAVTAAFGVNFRFLPVACPNLRRNVSSFRESCFRYTP